MSFRLIFHLLEPKRVNMYLSIPRGMKYEQIVSDDIAKDYFVDPEDKLPKIDIQKLLKDALRANTGRKKSIELNEFTIYIYSPPNDEETYLKYIPHKNGKEAMQIKPEEVKGYSAQRHSTMHYTSNGQTWCSQFHLSEKRREEIDAKREAQRENRRHYGDCPLST